MQSQKVAHQGPPPPDPGLYPKQFCEWLIQRIAATDKEGFFMWPVDERITPGYYSVIKNPMCFSYMKNKLQQDAYSTWRSFIADFELIINNARTFNKASTKCHRCAVALQRNSSKIIKQYELELRRAFSTLYPAAAAAADAAEAAAAAMQPPMQPMMTMSAGPNTSEQTSHGDGISSEHQASPYHAGSLRLLEPLKQEFSMGVAAAAAAAPPPLLSPSTAAPAALPLLPLPPMPREQLSTYISDNEDDVGLQQSMQQQQPVNAEVSSGRLGRCLADQQPQSIETVLMQLRVSVLRQPWPSDQAGSGAAGAGPSSLNQQALDKQKQSAACGRGGGTSHPPEAAAPSQLAPSGRSAEWKRARRPIEWQCRWLELRMRELKAQQQRLEAQLAGVPTAASSADAPAAALAAASSAGSSATVAAELGQRQVALAAASARFLAGGSEISADRRPLAGTLFYEMRAGKAATAALLPSQPQPPAAAEAGSTGEGVPAAATSIAPQLLGSCASPLPTDLAPAAIYTGVEALEQQLAALRKGLASAFQLERGAGAARGGRTGPGSAQRGGSVGAGGVRRGPGRPARPAGLTIVTRPGEVVKRKRSDSDLGDVGGGAWTPLTSFASMRSADRAVSNIYIPPVRDLPEHELEARAEAITVWAQAYREQGAVALSQPPPKVAALLQADREEAGGSSSEEDSSDEAYAALHSVMEEEERNRFAAFAAEGQRRRNKSQSKTNQQGKNSGQGGSKNQGGQQSKQGLKAPRGTQSMRWEDGLLSPTAAGAAAAHAAFSTQPSLPLVSSGTGLQVQGSLASAYSLPASASQPAASLLPPPSSSGQGGETSAGARQPPMPPPAPPMPPPAPPQPPAPPMPPTRGKPGAAAVVVMPMGGATSHVPLVSVVATGIAGPTSVASVPAVAQSSVSPRGTAPPAVSVSVSVPAARSSVTAVAPPSMVAPPRTVGPPLTAAVVPAVVPMPAVAPTHPAPLQAITTRPPPPPAQPPAPAQQQQQPVLQQVLQPLPAALPVVAPESASRQRPRRAAAATNAAAFAADESSSSSSSSSSSGEGEDGGGEDGEEVSGSGSEGSESGSGEEGGGEQSSDFNSLDEQEEDEMSEGGGGKKRHKSGGGSGGRNGKRVRPGSARRASNGTTAVRSRR